MKSINYNSINQLKFNHSLIIYIQLGMAYPFLGVDHEITNCYFFMRELEHCHQSHLYPKTKCEDQLEDLLQCHGKNKQIKTLTKYQEQLRKAKVINVPHYDRAEDRFVFDDGKVVSNTDPIFARFKWI